MTTNICEKLKNLFEKHTNYNSFACSSQNKYGLKLNIIQDGDSCYSDFKLDRMYTGFPKIIKSDLDVNVEVHIKTNNLTLVVGSLTYKLISDILLKRYFGEKFYTEFIKIKNEYN